MGKRSRIEKIMNPQVHVIYLFTSLLQYEYGQSDEPGYNAFMCAIGSKIWETKFSKWIQNILKKEVKVSD